jgi:protocatechuate 4,5-dioxygenase alpha chain
MADEVSARIEYDKAMARSLQGTYLFDGTRAAKNYALNKMCMSLTKPENRVAFATDERAYCRKFALDDDTVKLVESRDWIGMVRSGGNIYYVFKITAIDARRRAAERDDAGAVSRKTEFAQGARQWLKSSEL